MKKWWIIGAVVAIVLALGIWNLAIDDCLDGGGRWVYMFGGCDH